MSQENKFHRILLDLGIFGNIRTNVKFIHPRYPLAYLEVDNVAQKGTTIFVFEGKSKNVEEAVSQLKERHLSLIIHRNSYIRHMDYLTYTEIRLFCYNLKKKSLIEFNAKGEIIKSFKFDNILELKEILRKI